MLGVRGLLLCVVGCAVSVVVGLADPRATIGADSEPTLSATLDGIPIPLEEVGQHYCDDFAFPVIRCSSSRLVIDVRATVITLLTGIDYVTIYDQTVFGGASMNVSQDYSALSLIGWNDRISSFKGRNSETGAFYTDWFYGGSHWTWCCNQQSSSLGTFSDTFSSILRT